LKKNHKVSRHFICFNPFPEAQQLILLGIVPKQVCRFSSLSISCSGCKTNSRRAARRLIVLHPKQNIESEQKWQTCFCASKWIKCNNTEMLFVVKGLNHKIKIGQKL